ncbi:hypothetical protein PaG_03476 [Moesziomyces aphidis]|uniref:2-dehydropantoate 2-reductase n=1 Tax=Moesziomyces aphidis TaxID=84754 RepID=W3VLH1_MOEAP|nr:hypothetical protein PaG_03476 [Moesziomyces aphidis]
MSDSAPVHVLIVGAGAVGCFYASKLHGIHSGRDVRVSLVCRSNYKAIAENGVQLETHSFGNYHFTPYRVFSSIKQAGDYTEGGAFQWDYVVVTTKALPDITNDALDIAPLVTRGVDGSCIVLIQNGVGIEEVHRAEFGQNPIAKPNSLLSDSTLLGQLSSVTDKHIHQLVSWFTANGIRDAEFASELSLQQTRWHKLCINASMNPSSVLSGGTPNARMALDSELRTHLHACMNEIFTTAPKILGIEFDAKKHASPDRILKSTERNTGGKPSMLLDWQAGRPMELEVILGNPIRIARRDGLDMPRLQTLYALLKMAQTRKAEEANPTAKL